ncbi:MAG: dihydroorotate dehydrogenase (quinone) [Zetaproteobacteria bacterium]|nr:MAG: dihydroorotate dehydrogenase (quinone) [Zetaproteobacteria bacterium]
MLKLYKYVRPAIFKIDPETTHKLTIKALKTGAIRPCSSVASPLLEQDLFNLKFANPVGLSAGFDKNAEIIAAILNMGFGCTEVGTVTPKPQNGNPRPRIFRDVKSGSVINRMGFPNGGLRVFKPNIEKFMARPQRPQGVVGINIGMNKEQLNPAEDYCALIRELAPLADYITVNISSPNTPGLRDLQQKDILLDLITKMMKTRQDVCGDISSGKAPAFLIKLAPDLNEQQQEEIAETLMASGVDGVILSNTTLDRPEYLPADFNAEKGGLSGAPVRDKSTAIIRNFYRLTKGKLPIIGVGGISNAEHAYDKIKAGASLIQLYTGMIYEGPEIANNINKGLIDLLKADGLSSITEAIGLDHK